MTNGCNIYFTPENPSWVGTPEFIRGVASWLDLQTFDSLRVYRHAPSESEVHPTPAERETLQEMRAVPVETAIPMQHIDAHHTTVMNFGTTGKLTTLFQDVLATLPESLSEVFAPTEGSIYNGPWQHYDYTTGDQVSDSACCVVFGNQLGYPVELDAYLEAFLKVPSVATFQQRLEELSGQSWRALIDLT